MSKRHMLKIMLVRGSCDVTKASRKAKTRLYISSWTCIVSSFHLQFEIMTSRLIRMLISDHCELNDTRQCNLISGDVLIVKTNNTRRCRDLLISLFVLQNVLSRPNCSRVPISRFCLCIHRL